MKKLCTLFVCILLLLESCDSKGENTPLKSVDAATVQSLILKGQPVALKNITINGDLYFTKSGQMAPVGKSKQQTHISASIYFENCRFSGRVVAYAQSDNNIINTYFQLPVVFHNCSFEKTVDLRATDFNQQLSVSNCRFKGDVLLQSTHINDDFKLDNGIFDSSLFLQEAVIRGVCWGKEAQVKGQFSMQQADLWQDAFFAGLIVNGYADFGQVHFRKSAFFEYSTFNNTANYGGAVFQYRAEWTKAKFKKVVDMSNAWFSMKPVFLNIEKNESILFTDSRFDNGRP